VTGPLRALCVDIEGGHGGSSRSLFFALAAADRRAVAPEVWCRKEGPLFGRYRELGISVRHEPRMPRFTVLSGPTRNVAILCATALALPFAWRFVRRLARAARDRFDVVHLNHESLAVTAMLLRLYWKGPIVLHIRTNPPDGLFARLQAGLITRFIDRRVFISRNEEATYRRQGGAGEGRVILNPVAPAVRVAPDPRVPGDGRLVVVALSNFAYARGTDRLVEIAQALDRKSCNDIVFVVAGDRRLRGSLPGKLGAIARKGGSLADYAEAAGVSRYFVWIDHTSEPERLLAGADLLVKPTREGNPWGRDVIEAMAASVPVMSYGTDPLFVEDGVTGILRAEFRAEEAAAILAELHADRGAIGRMAVAARARVNLLCDARSRAGDLAEVWHEVAGRKTEGD